MDLDRATLKHYRAQCKIYIFGEGSPEASPQTRMTDSGDTPNCDVTTN